MKVAPGENPEQMAQMDCINFGGDEPKTFEWAESLINMFLDHRVKTEAEAMIVKAEKQKELTSEKAEVPKTTKKRPAAAGAPVQEPEPAAPAVNDLGEAEGESDDGGGSAYSDPDDDESVKMPKAKRLRAKTSPDAKLRTSKQIAKIKDAELEKVPETKEDAKIKTDAELKKEALATITANVGAITASLMPSIASTTSLGASTASSVGMLPSGLGMNVGGAGSIPVSLGTLQAQGLAASSDSEA